VLPVVANSTNPHSASASDTPFCTSEQAKQKKTGRLPKEDRHTRDRNGDYRANHKEELRHDKEVGHKKELGQKKESNGFARGLVSAVYRFAGQLQLNSKFSSLFLVIRHVG
jgi:hypothetical protein